ncbi:winged helix DNA-binding protein [Spirosoma sp. HMF3257]|uniref:MarR family transcriptional regulator n=1 Tax=Spirosoma telluris TaxID=2183553 RepID=A0A327NEA9_9BACT|nr:winged helix DNA-binding protein [Spirosoma telluris]RAI73447.1 MarR family transcriptional regulator [Spirosoma telluris]
MDSKLEILNQLQQRNIAGRIHRFSRILSSLSEHRWATDGFPEVRSGHVQLLSNVDPEGTRNTVLAQRAQITKQTMGRLVRELTESGYVFVLPDPIDRRAQQVQLTERGKSFLSYLATTLIELETAFSKVVGAEKWSEFTTTFYKLLTFVESRQQQLGI